MDSMINEICPSYVNLFAITRRMLSTLDFTKRIFNTKYDCLQEGYKESKVLLENIGEKQVNTYDIIVRFTCQEKAGLI